MSGSNRNSANDDINSINNTDVDGPRRRKRNTVGHLPWELLKFVKNDSYSLLIKGKPGTGKTTFALTLLDNLNDDSNYFYISTRLSLKQLSFYYPWVEKFFSKDENKSGYRFEDARLDEPESLFERITNQLMDVKSPVIIIDTWDTIASFMDRESRLNNERVLQIWRERAGAKLIFLSETFDLGILDSIVDGVITLENSIFESINNRQMTINKLRGLPIRCSSYSYSLYNGVFYTSDLIRDLNLFLTLEKIKPFYERSKSIVDESLYKLKSKRPDDFDVKELFIRNNFISILVENEISNELLISLLLKPLCFWINKANNKLMLNNLGQDFRHLCERILNYHLTSDKVRDQLLKQEIDFTSSFGILGDTSENAEFHGGKNKIGLEKKTHPEIENSEGNTNPKLYNSVPIQSETNILNIMNASNLLSLINDESFSRILQNNFATNVIILNQLEPNFNLQFIEKGIYIKMNLVGKNILIKVKNEDITLFETIIDRSRLFVEWRPVL
ncbi:MAG: AAA family ATPase [Candidatus Nitrosocosmicus sp.]|nr:AAA family ATPase [Candidatus Nitrosocosmicus sp.]MDN5865859.1 AAA family ATPase [Candidatus Nitrosocosmicus sp.]